jgi:hypothetical protein
VEAGGHPSSSQGARTLTLRDQQLRVVTIQQPVVRTTVGGATTIVRLLGPGRTAAVVGDGDSTLFGYLSGSHGGSTVPSSAFRRTGTIFVPEPTTVTETVTRDDHGDGDRDGDQGRSTDTTSAP